MWACTSCFSPNPISPDKTLVGIYFFASFDFIKKYMGTGEQWMSIPLEPTID